jgi:hypothetical protein
MGASLLFVRIATSCLVVSVVDLGVLLVIDVRVLGKVAFRSVQIEGFLFGRTN